MFRGENNNNENIEADFNAAAMDIQLVFDMLTITAKAEKPLNADAELAIVGDGIFALASEKNVNPFCQVPEKKVSLISDKAELKGLESKDTYLYDIWTKAGQSIVLVKQ